jgi:hypothetical protein
MDKLSIKKHHHHGRHPVVGWMLHYMKWWLAFTGLISSTSVCPFCGTPGCPVGIGLASAMGGIFALFTQKWKDTWGWVVVQGRRLLGQRH